MLSASPLSVAQQKLQATDVPIQLRVTYYLRLSCSVLNSDHIRYSSLMQALSTVNPAWLDTCTVTPLGTLHSSHRTINQLLKPITALHQTHQLTQLQMPLAA
jgi:hypothetical protein